MDSCVGTALRIHHPDVGEVACESVDVESVSDDEFVGDGESYIFGIDVVAASLGLVEERGHSDRCGIHGFEVVDKAADGGAGIYDVLHNDDVASGDILAQSDNLLDTPVDDVPS